MANITNCEAERFRVDKQNKKNEEREREAKRELSRGRVPLANDHLTISIGVVL